MAVDGERMGLGRPDRPRVGELAGAHGVGRIDMIENRLVGIKSREVYKAPAAALLMAAYAGVEELVVRARPARTPRLASPSDTRRLVYNGLWYSPLRAGAARRS